MTVTTFIGKKSPMIPLEIHPHRIEVAKALLEKREIPVVTHFLKEVAKAHDAVFATVNNTYYTFIKKGIPENVQELIAGFTSLLPTQGMTIVTEEEPKREEVTEEVTTQETEPEVIPQQEAAPEVTAEVAPVSEPEPSQEPPETEPVKPTYRIGTLINVKITDIQPQYGANFHVTDDPETTGFISVKNITNQFVSDVNRWFTVGTHYNIHVIKMEQDNRISGSTRQLPMKIKPMINPNQKPSAVPQQKLDWQEQLAQIKIAPQEPKKEEPTVTTSIAQSVVNPSAPVSPLIDREWEHAKPFIAEIIGSPVSPEAEALFKKMMHDSGVFTFTTVLIDQKQKLSVDLGVILAGNMRDVINIPRGLL